MSSIEGFSPLPPAAPVPAPTPAAPMPAAAAPPEPASRPVATPEAPMAPAQQGVLDEMMAAFMADGQISYDENQALAAVHRHFVGGWEGVPLPDASPDPVPAHQHHPRHAKQGHHGAHRVDAPPPVAARPPLAVEPADYAALAQRAAALGGKAYGNSSASRVYAAIHARDGLLAEANKPDPFGGARLDGDGNNLGAVAMVGNQAFTYADRYNPGLMGGWDSPGLGTTYVTEDPLMASGGESDIHYWPDCQDPAYKAFWDMMFAANNGDKAAWTELAQLKLAYPGQAWDNFAERRPMWLMPDYVARQPAQEQREQDRLATEMLAARDRWAAGGTQVTLANDPDYATKVQAQMQHVAGLFDRTIQAEGAYLA